MTRKFYYENLYARKLPPENAELPIRNVKIEGVCGVHVNSTGQVGLIKITSFENHNLKCGVAAMKESTKKF